LYTANDVSAKLAASGLLDTSKADKANAYETSVTIHQLHGVIPEEINLYQHCCDNFNLAHNISLLAVLIVIQLFMM
jgi:hypothetical protein